MDDIYIIEFSKKALEIGGYPFHIQRLTTATSSNRYTARHPNQDWIAIYADTKDRCDMVLPEIVNDMLTDEERSKLPSIDDGV